MNITWFHSHLLNFNSGGTRLVLDYCQLLKKNHKHKITIVCDRASQKAIEKASSSGIKIIQLDKLATNSPIYWLTLYFRIFLKRSRIAPLLNKSDLIVNSMFPMNWLVANSNIPKIQICYEPYAFFYNDHFLKNFSSPIKIFFRIMKLLYSSADKRSVRKMDEVFAINEIGKGKIYETYEIPAKKTYAGVDNNSYKQMPKKDFSSILKKHPGTPLLFHSTDLTGIKGTFYFLEIIKELIKTYPKLMLLITVYVDDKDGIKKLLKTIKKLKLEKNTEYLGCLKKNLLPKYYNAVDFVCQPSLNQPASWPLKESLACGTPIIGGPESEEVLDFVNGIKINPKHIKASANKIIRVINNKNKLKVNKKEIVDDYSIDKCVLKFNNQLLETYEIYKNK